MANPPSDGSLPSLLATTIRRSTVVGRLYLIIGTVMCLFFFIILGFAAGQSDVALLLPVFAVSGGMGALVVFTNDRVKGVFEYLIAYGIAPRRLFINVLIASLALVTIVLGVAMAGGVGILVAAGPGVSRNLAMALLLYSLPMGYAAVIFAATLGMFWTSLSSPRVGMNSPIGLVPIIGIFPPLATLIAAEAAGPAYFYAITEVAVLILVLVVVVLVSMVGRLMPNERLLSPA